MQRQHLAEVAGVSWWVTGNFIIWTFCRPPLWGIPRWCGVFCDELVNFLWTLRENIQKLAQHHLDLLLWDTFMSTSRAINLIYSCFQWNYETFKEDANASEIKFSNNFSSATHAKFSFLRWNKFNVNIVTPSTATMNYRANFAWFSALFRNISHNVNGELKFMKKTFQSADVTYNWVHSRWIKLQATAKDSGEEEKKSI